MQSAPAKLESQVGYASRATIFGSKDNWVKFTSFRADLSGVVRSSPYRTAVPHDPTSSRMSPQIYAKDFQLTRFRRKVIGVARSYPPFSLLSGTERGRQKAVSDCVLRRPAGEEGSEDLLNRNWDPDCER